MKFSPFKKFGFVFFLIAITISVFAVHNPARPPGNSHATTAKELSGNKEAPTTKLAKPSAVKSSIAKLPLTFELNQGQTDSQVKFLSHGNGYNLFLTPQETVLSLTKPAQKKSSKSVSSTLKMKLLGANESPEISGVNELPGKSNYYLGTDPTQWRVNVPHYSKVKYTSVYPGIDLLYYGQQQKLEYDFIIAPHTDSRIIRLSFDGASKLRPLANGNLELTTTAGKVIQQNPKIYQTINGVKLDIKGHYVLRTNREVGFEIGAYNKAEPLIIDPLIYATFLGGSAGDTAVGVAADSTGNAYILGITSSTDFPVTPGAFQTTNNGTTASLAFVTKLNANGTVLEYSTYLGSRPAYNCPGISNTNVNAITVDTNGNAYLAGYTNSRFPTIPADNSPLNCSFIYDNGFVTRLDPQGAMVFSKLIPDTNITDLAVDANDRIHVTGSAGAGGSSFRTTPNAYDRTGGGAFIALIDQATPQDATLPLGAASPLYASYIGNINATRLAIDSFGNTYVSGWTAAQNYPTTTNALQPAYGGGFSDGILVKFDMRQSGAPGLQYATYAGGNNDDFLADVAVSRTDLVSMVGSTKSHDFYNLQWTIGDTTSKGFLARIDPSQSGSSAFQYAYLLGFGTIPHYGVAVGVDGLGQAYALSRGDSPFSLITAISADGNSYIDSFRSIDSGIGNAMAVAADGTYYVTGGAIQFFGTSANAYQPTLNGVSDSFVYKFQITPPPPPDPQTCDAGSYPGVASANRATTEGSGGGDPTPTPCTIDPLIFIPGIAASRLDSVDPITKKVTNEYPGSVTNAIWSYLTGNSLSLKPGEINPTIYAPDVLREDTIQIFSGSKITKGKTFRTYKNLLDMLTNPSMGNYYEYHLFSKPTLEACSVEIGKPKPTLFVFPYDWRFSIDDNAIKLASYVKCINTIYPNNKVNILAHSMGGLLSQKYILTNPGKVNKLITIGSPWIGAPKALNIMEQGDFFEDIKDNIPGLSSEFKRLAEYHPSQHQLLPSRYYFALGGRPFAEQGWDINENDVKNEVYDNYEQFVDLMNKLHPATNPGTTNNNFHTEQQDDWRNNQTGVKYYHLVGEQFRPYTFEQLIANGAYRGFLTPSGNFLETQYNFFSESWGIGDGTVPALSATRRGNGISLKPSQDSLTIIYKSNSKTDDDYVQHTEMVENRNLQRNILEILRDQPITFGDGPAPGTNQATVTNQSQKKRSSTEGVVNTQSGIPGGTLDTGQDSTELQHGETYYLTFLGLELIGLSDSEGHNGELISLGNGVNMFTPGNPYATYRVGADEINRAGTLNLPADGTEYTITFKKKGQGANFILEKGVGNAHPNQIIKYYNFTDPGIQDGTLFQLKITYQGVQSLRFDQNNDGIFESSLEPNTSVSGAMAELNPPKLTVTSKFDSNGIFISVLAEDTESGVKVVYYSFEKNRYKDKYTSSPIKVDPNINPIIYVSASDNAGNLNSKTYKIPNKPSLSSASQSVNSFGGAFSVSVSTTIDVSWAVASQANWVVVNSGNVGTGSGAVAYTVAPNNTSSSRTGTINIGGQTFTVTQEAGLDTIPPTIIAPVNLTVNATNNQCAANVNAGSPTVDDNLPGVTFAVVRSDSKIMSEPFAVGVTTMTWKATDAAGNTATASQTVTVLDKQAPSLTVPTAVSVATAANATSCGVVIGDAALGNASALDNCSAVTLTRTGMPAGNLFAVGTTTITYTAKDAAGNITTGTQAVTVLDKTAPIISCPANLTTEFTASTGAVVNFLLPNATDNCAGAVTVTSSKLSGSVFPLGVTTVTLTATDAAGNKANCSFTVTVGGPRKVKQNVLAEMTTLRNSLTNTDDKGKLNEAITSVTNSLLASLWLDDSHLSSKNSDSVFQDEKDAVNKLSNLIKSKKGVISDALLQSFIDRLTRDDRQLAFAEMQDAITANGDAASIAKAQTELSKGDAEVAAGRQTSAIESYRNAWKFALKAVGKD